MSGRERWFQARQSFAPASLKAKGMYWQGYALVYGTAVKFCDPIDIVMQRQRRCSRSRFEIQTLPFLYQAPKISV